MNKTEKPSLSLSLSLNNNNNGFGIGEPAAAGGGGGAAHSPPAQVAAVADSHGSPGKLSIKVPNGKKPIRLNSGHIFIPKEETFEKYEQIPAASEKLLKNVQELSKTPSPKNTKGGRRRKSRKSRKTRKTKKSYKSK